MDRKSSSGGASSPVQLPSLPANPSITIPALPSDPSITLPALPPYPRSLPRNHPNMTVNLPDSSTNSSPGNGNPSGYAGNRASSGHGGSASSHLTLIAVLGVLVTVTALTLVSLLVFLIRRQRKQLMKNVEAPHGYINHKDVLQSPKNPLRKWLRGQSFPYKIWAILGKFRRSGILLVLSNQDLGFLGFTM